MNSNQCRAIFLLMFFFFLSMFKLNAQFAAKWGEIPKSDLEMKSYAQDTSASALVLSDYGESYFDDELNIVFNRHLRVKIFNTKGYSWGTHSVTLYTQDDTESISDIEGITYYLDENSSIIKNELSKKEIFKEKLDEKHTKYKFTLPLLKPGCIIDIKYKITSESFWFMKDWVFQYEEPVKWSEYKVTTPKQIVYAFVAIGYEQWAINKRTNTNQIFSGVAASSLGLSSQMSTCECYQNHWAVKDLPALRDEPFITTKEDYYNRVTTQLSAFSLVGTGVRRILNTWNTLVNELADHKKFGDRIDDTRQVTKKAKLITESLTTNDEKINAIYDWVTKSIVWNRENRLFAEQDVDDVLESAKGSSAEITFLFLSLLKSVGINGYPVILSTRSNGRIQDAYPIISQFNYVLAQVNTSNGYVFVDATNSNRPIELLPSKVLNTRGLVIREDSLKWVNIVTTKTDIYRTVANIKIDSEGNLDGIVEEKFEDYGALIARNTLEDKKDIEFAKDVLDAEETGINIDSVTITGKDSIKIPIKMICKVSSPNYAQTNGEIIYINPHFVNRYRNNPFKTEKRKFPVDYSFGRGYSNYVSIIIPPGYEIKETIPNRTLSVANNAISFNRVVQTDSGKIQVNYKLSINENEIKPRFYNNLRQFYEQIVASEAEQIVLVPIKK